MINGGRFDLIDENKPFVGTKPIPPGRNLYPAGLTTAQIEAYVKAHPGEKDAIYNPDTGSAMERSQSSTRSRITSNTRNGSSRPRNRCAKPRT